ncbi:MAG: ABC transporter substrate-binding protein [Cyanobacteria bacterium J06623_4]
MRRRKILQSSALLALSTAATVFLGSCNSPTASELTDTANGESAVESGETVLLRVALVPWLGWGETKIAESQGFFEEEGIEVEQIVFQSVTEVNTAFLSGQVDMAWLVASDLVVLSDTTPGLKFIYASDYSGEVDAVVGRNVASPADLAGKTIAREEVPYEIVFVEKFLESAGLTKDDVNVVPLTAADGSVALVAENLDAVATYEPFVSNAVNASEENTILFTAAGTNIIVNGLAGQEDLLTERREDVLAYLRALEKANQFRENNPEEANNIISEWIEVTPEEVADLMGKITMLDIADNKAIAFSEENELNAANSISNAGPILVEAGAAKAAPPGEELVDGSFVNEL